MIRLLQISDPHFGTEQQQVADALLRLADEADPEIILLSGDVTQRARRDQFEAARSFLDRFQRPFLVVPGNHDIPLFNLPARLLDPYGNYRRSLGEELEPEYETDELLVVSLNTTRPSRHKDGEVSDEQIARVAERLRQARPGQLRVVMQHHPVRAREECDVENLLHGREDAVPVWVDAGLDVLLGGHIHLPYIWPLYGTRGETGRKGWTVQAGTATSVRIRGDIPNSVNMLCYQPAAERRVCSVERWDFNFDQDRFVRSLATPIELD
ncbi:metallophosphoesterase [Halopseudomonas nanhaiensis]|uniref:metallophosphoesterase family protein n=1 Tax=Halopseudomonas nanhaiensis TaxID=2830842 RepID=UPI001CBD2925|nr:metallophosphoesterase [Halopseudomonas nanhaiensis]UAW98818.1 metallophosphoesterase [Halopseudomonas nanhaiensis]